jgi:hypothetical protein
MARMTSVGTGAASARHDERYDADTIACEFASRADQKVRLNLRQARS